MPSRRTEVVKISSPGDVITTLAHVLGFMPAESLVVACTHGPRHRFGLVMRFDLDPDRPTEQFAEEIEARCDHAGADGVFVVVFTAAAPADDDLPQRELVEMIEDRLGGMILDAFLVAGDRLWSYRCDDPDCCEPAGRFVDPRSPGALALAAAYALAGQGVLPDRQALARSVAYDGHDPEAMAERVESAQRALAGQGEGARRLAVRTLVQRVLLDFADPRSIVEADDAAALVALCDDPVVRDEVLVVAIKRRRREVLLGVLLDVARQIPPPHDAGICATLAWVAYANGDGAVANVAVDRALSTDPSYSLALLIIDSLDRQIPPEVLQQVMRDAARDLRGRSAAG